jgi:repressor LexA
VARKLSERQQKILRYIQDYVEERGYPPSIREIGERVGISSTSVVDYNLRALERDGLIRRDREVSRGLGVVGGSQKPTRIQQPRLIRIPVIGRIAAGVPIEAVEDPSDTIEFMRGAVPEDCFALRVKGLSMIEDHIEDGDIVVVRPQPRAENGEIVVAVVSTDVVPNGGATLKRFYREGDKVRQQPRNSEMEPIIVPADQVEIRGKVVKLVRDL